MKIYDISRAISEATPAWPGDVGFTWRETARLGPGAPWGSTCFTMSAHLGTHADAPLHVRDGWPGAHELPVDAFVGPASVVDVSTASGLIEADALAYDPDVHGERLLLRTGRTIASGHVA